MKKIIRPNEIKDYVGFSKNTAYRLMKLGQFPPRLQLGPSAVGWLSTEIDEWLASRPVIDADNVRKVAVGAKRGRPRKAVL
jgi:prophage regulatory protein